MKAALSLMVLGLAAACAQGGGPSLGGEPIAPSEVPTLAEPEPEASPAEYRAYALTYRLFGTQGQGSGAFATLARVDTWQTRDVRVGDLLGRNLTVVSIAPDALELAGPEGRIRLLAGEDVGVREVRHASDDAVRYLGRHRYAVDPPALARVYERRGVGATGESGWRLAKPGVELTSVSARGVLGRMGLSEADFLFSANDRTLSPAELDWLAREVASGRAVRLSLLRSGLTLTFSYAKP